MIINLYYDNNFVRDNRGFLVKKLNRIQVKLVDPRLDMNDSIERERELFLLMKKFLLSYFY